MLIISKHKDYYDYLQGIYGIDPLKILDRSEYPHKPFISEFFVLNFCGESYIKFKSDFFRRGRPFKEKSSDRDEDICKDILWNTFRLDEKYHTGKIIFRDEHCIWVKLDKPLKKEKFPAVVYNIYESYSHRLNWCTYRLTDDGIVCLLKDVEFQKIMSSEDAYSKIEGFISKQDIDMPLNPTDINRFEAKGFDKKKSFRK